MNRRRFIGTLPGIAAIPKIVSEMPTDLQVGDTVTIDGEDYMVTGHDTGNKFAGVDINEMLREAARTLAKNIDHAMIESYRSVSTEPTVRVPEVGQ